MAAASDPVVILSAARTPLGRFMGELSPFSAHKLGSHVIGAALERAKLTPERIDEVFMGNVLPAGQGQAPARQAARGARLPDATGATTINKVCGSGMKAIMQARDAIKAGIQAVFGYYSAFGYDVHQLTEGGDFVIAYGTFSATSAKSGKSVKFPLAEVWQFGEGGRIKLIQPVYSDTKAVVDILNG